MKRWEVLSSIVFISAVALIGLFASGLLQSDATSSTKLLGILGTVAIAAFFYAAVHFAVHIQRSRNFNGKNRE